MPVVTEKIQPIILSEIDGARPEMREFGERACKLDSVMQKFGKSQVSMVS